MVKEDLLSTGAENSFYLRIVFQKNAKKSMDMNSDTSVDKIGGILIYIYPSVVFDSQIQLSTKRCL